MRLVQVMFETHLRGLYRWGQVDFHKAEEVENIPGKSRRPFGKYREKLSLGFGGYVLSLETANEHPPLGHIMLMGPGGTIEENSLDAVALDRIGESIKLQHEELVPNG